MNIVLIVLVFTVVLIDFIKLNRKNKKITYVYLVIVSLIIITFLVDQLELFKMSPLEAFIEGMEPITKWVETKLK